MQLNGIGESNPLAAMFGTRHSPTVTAPPAGLDSPGRATKPSLTAGQILARYDLSDISPAEFSEFLQQLQAAGALNSADFQDLALVRLELDHSGIPADETIDLADFLRAQLARQDSPQSGQAMPAALVRALAWIEKSGSAESSGVDALA